MTLKLICHHYKFKSDAEFRKRTVLYDQNGYMKGKLSARELNNEWKTKANVVTNTDIVHLIDPIKLLIGRPVGYSNKLQDCGQDKFLSVVAMIRGEDDYLDEWLAFYVYQGVDHFYLYINDDTCSSTFDKLQEYVEKGFAIHNPLA